MKQPSRGKIDGRTPKARALNLSAASFDLEGNVTGGRDTISGGGVAVPQRSLRDIYRTTPAAAGVAASESGAGRIRKASTPDTRPAPGPQFAKPTVGPIMGDQLGKMDFSGAATSTAAMRGAQAGRDATAVGGAMAAHRAAMRTTEKAARPLTSTGHDLLTKRTAPGGFANSTLGKYGGGIATNMRDNDDAMRALGGRTSRTREVAAMRDASAAGVAAVDKMDSAMKLPDLQKQGPKFDFEAAMRDASAAGVAAVDKMQMHSDAPPVTRKPAMRATAPTVQPLPEKKSTEEGIGVLPEIGVLSASKRKKSAMRTY